MSTGPQVEDGFTRIANELFDAIILFPFSKREQKIVMAVIRKTYGFNKKQDAISLGELAKATGLDPAHISRAINDLVQMKVLLKQQGQPGQVLGLNKKYSEWEVLPKQQGVAETAIAGCQKSNSSIAKTATKVLPKRQPSKDKVKDKVKDSITPPISPPQGGDVIKLPSWLNPKDWEDFKAHRKKIRKPMTDVAEERALKVLEELLAQGHDPGRVINQSIVNGWMGLFPLRDQMRSTGPPANKQDALEAANKAAKEEWLQRRRDRDITAGAEVIKDA